MTPHDLEARRDLEKVGRLDFAEASGIKKGGGTMAVVIRSRETIPESLVRAKRAAGRKKDLMLLPELEALAALLKQRGE